MKRLTSKRYVQNVSYFDSSPLYLLVLSFMMFDRINIGQNRLSELDVLFLRRGM